MRILLLNQCFYPDVVSTAQHLTDLAVELAAKGHSVTVLASRRGYDNPATRYPARETWKGISIIRVPSLGLGKRSKWRRIVDFASYWVSCVLRLALLPRFDVVVALTSPPLISFLGAVFARIKGARFVFWAMDLNPDEAIAAGWLRERAPIARMLDFMLRYSLRRSDRIVALDRFMKQRIVEKGIAGEKVAVIPPWSHDDSIRYDEQGRGRFRRRYGLSEKFVVMYSGNHSPCHPLDTLLEAAGRLADHPQLAFCFVGGGKEFTKVQRFAQQRQMKNILCLPYQPLDELSASLSAADLHVVVLGDPFVGIVHPCKIYNILRIGSPFIAIGPATCHLTDLLSEGEFCEDGAAFGHGDVELVADCLEEHAAAFEWQSERRSIAGATRYSKAVLLPQMIDLLAPQEAKDEAAKRTPTDWNAAPAMVTSGPRPSRTAS
ncbi:MAG: glycosyltransferase family 4 protein [Thermoguttaceae bacterium]